MGSRYTWDSYIYTAPRVHHADVRTSQVASKVAIANAYRQSEKCARAPHCTLAMNITC